MYSWGLSFNVRQHPEVHLKYSQTNSRESPFSHKKRIVLLRRVIHCIIRVREIIRLNFTKGTVFILDELSASLCPSVYLSILTDSGDGLSMSIRVKGSKGG